MASPGVYKLNFDEASFPDAGAETGVVVKDEKGFFISAMADRIPFITEPLLALLRPLVLINPEGSLG